MKTIAVTLCLMLVVSSCFALVVPSQGTDTDSEEKSFQPKYGGEDSKVLYNTVYTIAVLIMLYSLYDTATGL